MGRKEGIETYTRSRLIGYAQLLQEIAQEYKAGQKRTEGAEEACLPRSSLLLREQERENTTIFAGFVMDTDVYKRQGIFRYLVIIADPAS